MDEFDFFTVDEMAKELKISKNSVYYQIHQAKAGISTPPFINLGNLVRFKVTDYDEWYNNL